MTAITRKPNLVRSVAYLDLIGSPQGALPSPVLRSAAMLQITRRAPWARVPKWGNSIAIRLPRVALEISICTTSIRSSCRSKKDRLETKAARPRYRLAGPARRITPDNQPKAMDFPAVGEGSPRCVIPVTSTLPPHSARFQLNPHPADLPVRP
jgi:hypothetical protein